MEINRAGGKSSSHPGRGGVKLKMPGVTPEQPLAAALTVKLEDVKKLEAKEAGKKMRR